MRAKDTLGWSPHRQACKAVDGEIKKQAYNLKGYPNGKS